MSRLRWPDSHQPPSEKPGTIHSTSLRTILAASALLLMERERSSHSIGTTHMADAPWQAELTLPSKATRATVFTPSMHHGWRLDDSISRKSRGG